MNYVVVGMTICLVICTGSMASADTLCGRDYVSIAKFEETLKAQPTVKVLPSDATVTSYVDADNVVWNFATQGNSAFPSVACRKVVEADGKLKVETLLNCEAAEDACQKLVSDYGKLDKAMIDAYASEHPQ
jgi:hypothetical protein